MGVWNEYDDLDHMYDQLGSYTTWNLPFWIFLAPPTAREPGIRVSHILMKWEALTSHDPTARRAAPKGRLQSELGLTILETVLDHPKNHWTLL